MPDEVKNILFFSKPAKNFLYGPVSLSKEKYMFFEVSSWNTLVSVTDEQKKQAYLDAEKTYRESTALKIYKKYVSVLMSQKELVFDPEVFRVFSDRISKIYLIEKEKKESVIQNTIWDEETKTVDDISSFNDLKMIRKERLLTFGNEKFSVGKGFEIYSVSLDQSKQRWIQAIAQDGLVWSNHVSDLRGWRAQGAAIYGVNAVPMTFLVDGKGKIIAKGLRGGALENALSSLKK